MLYLIDGVKIVTFAGNTPVTHDGFLNPLQLQVAAAIETSWVDVPICGNWFGDAGAGGAGWVEDWAYNRGDGTTIHVLKTLGPAVARYAYINLHGDPRFRPGSVIEAIHVMTGGSTTGAGKINLIRQEKMVDTGQYPGGETTVVEVAGTADDPFGGGSPYNYKLVSKTGISHTILGNNGYSIQVISPTANAYLVGCRIQVKYPITT